MSRIPATKKKGKRASKVQECLQLSKRAQRKKPRNKEECKHSIKPFPRFIAAEKGRKQGNNKHKSEQAVCKIDCRVESKKASKIQKSNKTSCMSTCN